MEVEFKGIKKIEVPKFELETNLQRWHNIKERALQNKPDRNDPQFGSSINITEYCDKMIMKCIDNLEC
jgi:hypothetical protein